ncbi:hypothetical protein N0V94_004096 [Neodidymelliopsis sp. IMI 364377]|nr:hypothetical protein N0V94_004096 [Neodidymelliopsis sp. IMI 364377]
MSRILGQGIAYTPEGFDRSQLAYLNKVPVVLPKDDGVNRMFLTAQAENPIEGSAWGLLLQYNCSIVKQTSDLILLKDREPSARKNISEGAVKGSYLPNGSSWVQVMNQTDPFTSAWASNAHAVVELAYELWPNRSTQEALQSSGPNATFTESTTCYFNENENITGDYPGIDQERIFEVLMWQKFFNSSYGDTSPQYNLTVDHNITELYGAYDYLDFAYNIPANQSDTYPGWPMTAIGVQCKSSSSVGTADIDGIRSTYSNFVRTDTPINIQRARCADRFGADILPMMLGPDYNSDEFLSSYFTSTAAPPLFYASYTDDPDSIDAGTGYMVSLNYLQASQLRQSMLHALSSYATQLMFNGGQGFTARDGSQVAYFNPNVTAFVTGPVIKQGVMPAGIPVALFFLWAFISTTLGATYGFRRRWSAILDGHTLFRLGVELKESNRQAVQKYPSVVEIEDCVALHSVPGLVGDMEPGSAVGRIGLVEGSVADKQKLYQ